MPPVTVGGHTFRIRSSSRSGRWLAHALRVDNGDRFGPEVAAASREEAEAAVIGWLEWQHDHIEALELLQAAERAYHRIAADHAFANVADRGAADLARRAAVAAVEHARARLDLVRNRRPPT